MHAVGDRVQQRRAEPATSRRPSRPAAKNANTGTAKPADTGRSRCSKCSAAELARAAENGHGEAQQHARDGGMHPAGVHQRPRRPRPAESAPTSGARRAARPARTRRAVPAPAPAVPRRDGRCRTTAITVIASRSSTTARVSRNVRSAVGRWVDNTASTASANAISVADRHGPAARGSPGGPLPRLSATKTAAGTTMPPMAAAIGSAARRGVAQVTGDELALELQPHDEEEDRQQPVGRPRRDAQVADASAAGPTENSETAW